MPSKKMNILIVEDDENNIDLFSKALLASDGYAIRIARSRDAALVLMTSFECDIAIIDLNIPTVDGERDGHESHGMTVYTQFQKILRGTPVIIFSAYGTIKLVRNLLQTTEVGDPWGRGVNSPLLNFNQKEEFADCIATIRQIKDDLQQLSKIDLSTLGIDLSINCFHKRALKIFARIHHGSSIHLKKLGGGLSGARTLKVDVCNLQGGIVCKAFAKLDSISKILDERSRYQERISPILGIGGFTPEIRIQLAGSGNIGGLFYQFAEGFDQSLLDVLKTNADRAASLISEIRKMESRWYLSAMNTSITIKDIRRSLVGDEVIEKYRTELPPYFDSIEASTLNCRTCSQHKDLHPLNILVSTEDKAIFIDYGTVSNAPACLDAVTLELSLFFHPDCKGTAQGWPTVEDAARWPDIDAYLNGHALSPYIAACRAWAFEEQRSDKAVFAVAYSYALRQLKYDDTDHLLALALGKAALSKLHDFA